MATAVGICVHDDVEFLEPVLRSIPGIPMLLFVSELDWNGKRGEFESAIEIGKRFGAEIVTGSWSSETEHRVASLEIAKQKGFTHLIILDSDEIPEPELVSTLIRIAESDIADIVHAEMETYWKSPEFQIRPREQLRPVVLLNLEKAHHVRIREFDGGRRLILNVDYGVLHHLSYAGSEQRIWKKITTWGHKDEVVPGWWERIWKHWDIDNLLRNLHPTHPGAYGFAERVGVPEFLQSVGIKGTEIEDLSKPKKWPTVSIVIPAFGGQGDLDACLSSLENCRDLIHEVIVVDNGSTPAIHVETDCKLIRNESNLGFAAASNQGAKQSSGNCVIFLNNDTQVPRCGLIRLIESLYAADNIAAAGPNTNQGAYHHPIDQTYTKIENLDLFADQIAHSSRSDFDVDILVGFCLAVRRSVLDQVGLFDEDFGLGTYEDNDLSYRMRREGYRLVIASRSYVHHEGSKTISRMADESSNVVLDPVLNMLRNEKKFVAKWKTDLETGYANFLSGQSAGRIQFNDERKPERRIQAIAPFAKQARISLCMIVKNEERVLADCLKSAAPFVNQIIVVDTGSTDSTVDIARKFGAEVHEIEWPESFAEARNESLKYATGDWVLWIDADDTLPISSGEAIVNVAINAPPTITAFVVPVQFIEKGGALGTRVDHVKLFRNRKGIHFEGRIHEQNLPSINAAGGEVARLDTFVLHSGYDTSPEGQAAKFARDMRLLRLDLKDRPRHPFVLFNIGMTRHFFGEHARAIGWFKRCLHYSSDENSHIRKVYALLAVSYRELKRYDEALATLTEGLNRFPDDPELHFHAAILDTFKGDIEGAERHYLACVSADIALHFSSVDIGILGYKAWQNVAFNALHSGDYEKARRYWKTGLEKCPKEIDLAAAWFEASLDAKDFDGSKEAMEHIRRHEPKLDLWSKLVAKYTLLTQGTEFVQGTIERIVEMHPNSTGPRMSLARVLVDSGKVQQAAPMLQDLAMQGYAEAAYCLGIFAVTRNDLLAAERWFIWAHELNPEHEQTKSQLEAVRRMRLDQMK